MTYRTCIITGNFPTTKKNKKWQLADILCKLLCILWGCCLCGTPYIDVRAGIIESGRRAGHY